MKHTSQSEKSLMRL